MAGGAEKSAISADGRRSCRSVAGRRTLAAFMAPAGGKVLVLLPRWRHSCHRCPPTS